MPQAHLRLLVLCVLLLGTSVVTQGDHDTPATPEAVASVFDEPPAYLHPTTAIGFDLSGLPASSAGGVEAALRESAQQAQSVDARAHTHMSLAVYYKLKGQEDRAAAEKRKGDYWAKVAKIVDAN